MKNETAGVTTVTVCEDFAKAAFDACGKSEVDDSTGTGCVRIVDVCGDDSDAKNPEYWLKSLSIMTGGTVEFKMDDEDCFNTASPALAGSLAVALAAVALAVLQ